MDYIFNNSNMVEFNTVDKHLYQTVNFTTTIYQCTAATLTVTLPFNFVSKCSCIVSIFVFFGYCRV